MLETTRQIQQIQIHRSCTCGIGETTVNGPELVSPSLQ